MSGIALLQRYIATRKLDINEQDDVRLIDAIASQLEDEIIEPDPELLEILEILQNKSEHIPPHLLQPVPIYPTGDGDKCEDYKVIRALGSGSFGDVSLVQDPKSDRKYALKKFKTDDKGLPEAMVRELNVLASLKHRNLVTAERIFMDGCDVCCLLEAMDNDLSDYIDKKKKYDPIDVFCQICCGIAFLHANDIIHSDLKPPNILVKVLPDEKLLVKVSDLDSYLAPQGIILNSYTITTVWYRAPETNKHHMIETFRSYKDYKDIAAQYQAMTHLTNKIDIWALGCILYELITGNPLLPADKDEDLAPLILGKVDRYFKGWMSAESATKIYGKIPKNLLPLLGAMLDLIPERRPTVFQILQSFNYPCVNGSSKFLDNPTIPIEKEHKALLRNIIMWLCVNNRVLGPVYFIAVDIFKRFWAVRKLNSSVTGEVAALISFMLASKLLLGQSLNETQIDEIMQHKVNMAAIKRIECNIMSSLNFTLYHRVALKKWNGVRSKTRTQEYDLEPDFIKSDSYLKFL